MNLNNDASLVDIINAIEEINAKIIDRGEARTIIPTSISQILEKGNYKGDITVEGDSNLISNNIVSGKSIFGVNGTARASINISSSDDIFNTLNLNSKYDSTTNNPNYKVVYDLNTTYNGSVRLFITSSIYANYSFEYGYIKIEHYSNNDLILEKTKQLYNQDGEIEYICDINNLLEGDRLVVSVKPPATQTDNTGILVSSIKLGGSILGAENSDSIIKTGLNLKITDSLANNVVKDDITSEEYETNCLLKDNRISFDGSNYIKIPSKKLNTDVNFTIQIKHRYSSFTSWAKLLGNEGTSETNNTLAVGFSDSKYMLYLKDNSNQVLINKNDINGIEYNKDIVCSLVRDNNILSFYINKTKVFEKTITSSILNKRYWYIGKNGENNNGYFNGDMSCILFYSRALTEEDIFNNIDFM